MVQTGGGADINEQAQGQQMNQGLKERAEDQDDCISDEDICASASETVKRPKLSALEELFAVEDMEIK